MTLVETQPAAVTILEADSLVGAFAPVLIEDGVTDLSCDIDTALHARGACIVIADITAGQADSGDTATITTATLPVFIFDAPGKAHSPAGLALVDAVISALTNRHDFRLSQFGRFTNEKGGTLTICEFVTTIVFNP